MYLLVFTLMAAPDLLLTLLLTQVVRDFNFL